MIDISFLIPVFACGLLIIFNSSIIGCFVLWKKMSYYGDSLSHASLFGIAFGLLLGIDPQLSIFCLACIFTMIFVNKSNNFSNDTLLGILSYSSLSLALIIISFGKIKIDLMGYLFGDLLMSSVTDIYKILAFTIIFTIWLKKKFFYLIQLCISEELLQSDGVNVKNLSFQLVMFLSIFIALSFKIVGAFLVSSLMIIPCAAAQKISTSPGQMVINSLLISAIGFFAGLSLALKFDLPTSPAIICCSLFMLLSISLIKFLKNLLI